MMQLSISCMLPYRSVGGWACRSCSRGHPATAAPSNSTASAVGLFLHSPITFNLLFVDKCATSRTWGEAERERSDDRDMRRRSCASPASEKPLHAHLFSGASIGLHLKLQEKCAAPLTVAGWAIGHVLPRFRRLLLDHHRLLLAKRLSWRREWMSDSLQGTCSLALSERREISFFIPVFFKLKIDTFQHCLKRCWDVLCQLFLDFLVEHPTLFSECATRTFMLWFHTPLLSPFPFWSFSK